MSPVLANETELSFPAKIPPKSIAEFNAVNPMANIAKDDDYWDLAWHAKVADYGDMNSQFILAEAYELGKNTEPNPKKSLAYYKKAAKQGHFEACMKLGKIYTENKWVKEDLEQAEFWYKKAAEQGYVPAQIKLSDMAEHQKKVDYKEAYYWLAIATKQMFPHEIDLESKSPHLIILADKMTPEEYEDVLERLEDKK
ncbi:MAG: sel1 repeat family protein [Alphaproteobacteria bacterium]|nr:sel1 repeat family protein [Alphaproteobacteria bacterium]